jgi:hypothetical protein
MSKSDAACRIDPTTFVLGPAMTQTASHAAHGDEKFFSSHGLARIQKSGYSTHKVRPPTDLAVPFNTHAGETR